ncbi:GNAT family N-acetyltransferase [Lipingzhangella rawalii]
MPSAPARVSHVHGVSTRPSHRGNGLGTRGVQGIE